ncbi:hypothetical protein CDL23_08020 [Mediterraneibacter gnavus]|uniref:Uncharacterized protein n=1 Tax=Mediterraneibacter gnavus TaxID=33038 RepID=A0A2N5PKK8_MEDGN|nr:hypothetical protein CDL23_08020 [Mediterraneibacter gnavus]
MPWSVGTSRFDPCTRFCDVRFAAYQLGVAVGVHTGLTLQMVPKRRYPQICKTNKNRFSNLYLV